MNELVFSPTDFVAILNQTLEYAYPVVAIEGEIANFRVSRGKWVYFDIKDETSSLRCFGSVYTLPGPLEDGMVVRVTANPRLHPLYNFSLNLQSIVPVGEGSLKRAADLLRAKLEKEGLFDPARKRLLPYPPETIGLITSKESAAYADFVKVLGQRWGGLHITHCDVQVQGDVAPADIVGAIEAINQLPKPPELLVVTRGGGSAEDLAAFNSENVVRAIATSRIPTLVAIGHEVDLSLAELAADKRASTPSNAAELISPDRKHVLAVLHEQATKLAESVSVQLKDARTSVAQARTELAVSLQRCYSLAQHVVARQKALLAALNPELLLRKGYAVIRTEGGSVIKSVKALKPGMQVTLQLHDGSARAHVDGAE